VLTILVPPNIGVLVSAPEGEGVPPATGELVGTLVPPDDELGVGSTVPPVVSVGVLVSAPEGEGVPPATGELVVALVPPDDELGVGSIVPPVSDGVGMIVT